MYVLEDVQKYYQGIDILHISQQRGVIIIDEEMKLCTSKSVTFAFETKNHQNFHNCLRSVLDGINAITTNWPPRQL